MSKTFRSWDYDQEWLLPPSVHDLVPAEHPAHFVRELVRETLDLSSIFASCSGDRGYPPCHPGMMAALLLYAYSRGVYSSRSIARGCEGRVDFMAVTAHQRPDFRTISDFRKRHLAALGGLFAQVLALCQQAGLAKLGHVALDGTRIKANASRHKAMSYGRMMKAEPALAAEVAAWLERAAAADAAGDAEHGKARRGDDTPAWMANRKKRLARIRAAMAALEAEALADARAAEDGKPHEPKGAQETPAPKPADKKQRNFTDPESRILKTRDGFIQGYNAQAAADADHQVIVAHGLSASGSDQDQLAPMVAAIEKEAGRLPDELSADASYCSEANLKVLDDHAIRGYLATGRQKHGTAAAVSKKAAPSDSLRAAMTRRLRRGGWRSRYRLRKITIEPVFGQIKQARGFRQFLLRGIDKVRHEWALICIAHNINKLAACAAHSQAARG